MKTEQLPGLLKMKVIRGIDLAVRDYVTSDPYVVVRFGKHKLQTHVVKKNVNPEWNEDLTLLIDDHTQVTQPIKLQVYDKDTFSLDDSMGQAEIDIQPFFKALSFRSPDISSNAIINKIVPDRSNFYAEESRIYLCDGSVVQDAILRLRNVETGELVIQLRWVDVPNARSL